MMLLPVALLAVTGGPRCSTAARKQIKTVSTHRLSGVRSTVVAVVVVGVFVALDYSPRGGWASPRRTPTGGSTRRPAAPASY